MSLARTLRSDGKKTKQEVYNFFTSRSLSIWCKDYWWWHQSLLQSDNELRNLLIVNRLEILQEASLKFSKILLLVRWQIVIKISCFLTNNFRNFWDLSFLQSRGLSRSDFWGRSATTRQTIFFFATPPRQRDRPFFSALQASLQARQRDSR